MNRAGGTSAVENVHSRAAGWVGHCGKSRSASIGRLPSCCQICSYSCSDLLVRRVRRPVDAYAPEVFEAHLDGAVVLIQGGVER